MKELVIDISKWDEGIDLQAWKTERNLWGVIIKAGGHEDAVGGRYMDPLAKKYYSDAVKLGLHIGFYYYTDVRDVATANADANHFIQLISDIVGDNYYDLPCYMDVEDPRQMGLSSQKLTDLIKSFCNTLIFKGYYAGLYTSGNAWLNNMHAEELRDYANWIAWWKSTWPSEAGDIGMWQQGCGNINGDLEFADNGKVGYRDIDWCCIDYPSRIKEGMTKQPRKYIEPSESTQEESSTSEEIRMGRATDVIDAAYGELGYYASDDPEPGSRYGRWMAELFNEDWLAGPSREIWWCCMFVSWCLDRGGVKMDGFPTYNTDVALNGGAKKYSVDKTSVQYGDIIIFNWDWNDTTDHIGFATGSFDGSGFTTIEGNVGNAVKECYRQLGNVAWVLRPPYESFGVVNSNAPSIDISPKNNRDGGKLDIDGIGGWNTIIDIQHQLGTDEDGWISGQVSSNRPHHIGMSNVTYEGTGSMMVKALQNKVGADSDGHWGPDTSRKTQQWLIDHGYSCGDSGVDGYFGHDSVCALQTALNDGAFS